MRTSRAGSEIPLAGDLLDTIYNYIPVCEENTEFIDSREWTRMGEELVDIVIREHIAANIRVEEILR